MVLVMIDLEFVFSLVRISLEGIPFPVVVNLLADVVPRAPPLSLRFMKIVTFLWI